MGEITVCTRKCYSGLNADKPASANLGDSYFASDTLDTYFWDGAAWALNNTVQYVPRLVAAVDKQVGDFTTDGTWKVDGLDLSGIVPAGAVAVNVRFSISDGASNSYIYLRKNATNSQNIIFNTTQVTALTAEVNAILAIDPDRLIDYMGVNLAFTTIDLIVVGWFI